ncbi:MAG: zf-HC2 domain-containing protein [Candidatus Eisenbacteria bacterium]|nr:zf-HC2 domain-containing protein [Candidatus Eisenbacteria bacterium]
MRDCKKAKQRFSEYFDEILEGDSKRDLERHLDACPECRKAWNSYRSLYRQVRNLPPVEVSGDFEARLRARIRREEAPRRAWWQDLSRMPLPLPVGAAALLLVAVFSYTRLADRPAPPMGENAPGALVADTAHTRENTLPSFLPGGIGSGNVGMSTVSGGEMGPPHPVRFRPTPAGRQVDWNGDPIMGPDYSHPANPHAEGAPTDSHDTRGSVDTGRARG